MKLLIKILMIMAMSVGISFAHCGEKDCKHGAHHAAEQCKHDGHAPHHVMIVMMGIAKNARQGLRRLQRSRL